jgi:hypothetical protein
MDAYYYASGKKIELDHDPDYIAVDERAATQAGVDIPASATAHAANGIIVATRSAVPEETLDRLRNAGALQRVFKRDRALIIPLPEVRIEVDNPRQRAAVLKALDEVGERQTIADEGGERIVVKPASGDGADALKIANHVYEQAKPAAASVRFMQFVPKPDLVR